MIAARDTVKEIISFGGQAIHVKADVSVPGDTLEMANKAADVFGRIDILVNNAAIRAMGKLTYGDFMDLDLDEWDRMMAVNLQGPFLCKTLHVSLDKFGAYMLQILRTQFCF